MTINNYTIFMRRWIDIYMNPRLGRTGTDRDFMNHIKYYQRPIVASNGRTFIDEGSPYPDLCSIPTDTNLYRIRRNLDTAICVCIYNEGAGALTATLTGIYQNLQHMPIFQAPQLNRQNRQDVPINHHMAQPQVREKLAVFVIQDGITKCDSSIIQFLRPYEMTPGKSKLEERRKIIEYETTAIEMRKREVNPSHSSDFPWSIPEKTSLMYEIEWQPENARNGNALKVFLVFKHLNGKKLSSHGWFFEGFCRYLQPTYCLLLDVGTVPDEKGIVNMIGALAADPSLGGVSGFMNIDASLASQAETTNQNPNREGFLPLDENPQNNQRRQGNLFERYCFSIEKAQASEYIMSHFLDKNFESAMGFLHVLPGAWSGYRLAALQAGEIYERDILQSKYFRTLINPNEQLGAAQMMKTANMYLAEDRILCLAIYCQKNMCFYLKYIPDAKARTDPMKNEVDLQLQRRRWNNSSLYAFEYVRANYETDMSNSKHGAWDQIRMHINVLMSSLSFFNASLIPCFFLFIFFSTIRYNGLITNDLAKWITAVVLSIPYIIAIIISIGGSMNGNIWIKDPYLYNANGEIRFQEDMVTPMKKNPGQKVYGNAHKLTIFLTLYNYLWFVAVGVFAITLIVEGIVKYNFDFSKMTIQSAISIIFLFANSGCYLVLLLVHIPTHAKEVWQLVIGFMSSLSYMALYTHTMPIFSICNVDDISWGTKGSVEKEGGKDFQKEKSYVVGSWILKNTVVCFILFMVDLYVQGSYITIGIAGYSTVVYCFKCVIAVINQLRFLFSRCCKCCY